MKGVLRFGLVLLVVAVAVRADAAEGLALPGGPVVLTVSGAIAHGNRPGAAEFDLAMLERLGLTQLVTSTPWTDGVPVFEGVRLADLLDAVGARGSTVRAIALNGYEADLPIDELRRYPVLLAMRMNGALLPVREKGPLWIVFPRDRHPRLADGANLAKWVWQVRELVIR